MARILVHSATGPENATRAALALLVARTAVEEGHEVQVFIAGDGVHLADEEKAASILKLIAGLEEHDDVQNVYSNFEVSDAVLAKLTAA